MGLGTMMPTMSGSAGDAGLQLQSARQFSPPNLRRDSASLFIGMVTGFVLDRRFKNKSRQSLENHPLSIGLYSERSSTKGSLLYRWESH